ncbi:protein disulfide oxidoreductase [Psychrobacter sp. I-STPA10]|uniref:protein disulfide oxidoreductase n=1 Tax=Psychrobacter sp. I-STPA10 TaxID=2585769 RepID=UPI001E4B4C2B|nr:protein disulfide oxidoreductase [Psychrobacter sp. I-STPA10]
MQTTAKKFHASKAYSWLKTLLGYLLIFIIIYSVVNWWRQPVMPANPQLELTDYQWQSVDIAALSQKSPVLVYFWGSWCGVCKHTSPTINTLANEGNYPVVTIAVQSGDNGELSQYMQHKGFSFTTINDEDGAIFANWQGQVTPSYVILKDGEMKQGLTGIQPLWSLKLRLWLSGVL